MTVSKSVPARPSLESLRKQAKKLVRDVAAGDPAAIEPARAHLPNVDLPLTQRKTRLAIAREYAFGVADQLAALTALTKWVLRATAASAEAWFKIPVRHAVYSTKSPFAYL